MATVHQQAAWILSPHHPGAAQDQTFHGKPGSNSIGYALEELICSPSLNSFFLLSINFLTSLCNSIVVYKFVLLICEHDYNISLLWYLSAVKLSFSCVYNIIELLGVKCALNRIIASYITPFWENNGFALTGSAIIFPEWCDTRLLSLSECCQD